MRIRMMEAEKLEDEIEDVLSDEENEKNEDDKYSGVVRIKMEKNQIIEYMIKRIEDATKKRETVCITYPVGFFLDLDITEQISIIKQKADVSELKYAEMEALDRRAIEPAKILARKYVRCKIGQPVKGPFVIFADQFIMIRPKSEEIENIAKENNIKLSILKQHLEDLLTDVGSQGKRATIIKIV